MKIYFRRILRAGADGIIAFGEFIFRNIPGILFYMYLLAIVTLFHWNQDASLSLSLHNFSQGLRSSVLLALGAGLLRGLFLLPILKNRLRLIAWLLTTLLVIMSLTEVWMSFMIHTRWSDRIIRLILDTNQGESGEFLQLYLFTVKSAGVILGFLLISRLVYLGLMEAGKWRPSSLKKLWKTRKCRIARASFAFLIAGAGIWWWSLPPENNYNAENNFNTLLRLHKMIKVHKKSQRNIKALEKTPVLADGVIPEGADAPTRIVWIIGESDSRAHWNLYGYYLPTTPRMNRLQKEGNLLKFDDVICFEPRTYRMMEILFSPYVVTDSSKYYLRQPLTPMIMRKAGYKVRLHDNQATLVRGDDQAEVGTCNFMNSIKLSNANFDYRNDSMYRYDMELIDAQAPFLSNSETSDGHITRTLDIFHINGQHFSAANRYPKGFGKFTERDYSRPDLNREQIRQIAAYDNATLYVDSLLMRIYNEMKGQDAIIIYHPDHGEEINDRRACAVRTMDSHKLPQSAPYVLEIPFIVMTTPEFRRLHPDLYARLVKAASEKQSLIYFSHFLLDLAGVESKYKKPQFSPLSTEWSRPPRVVKDIRTYDVWKEKNNVSLQIRSKK
ncbi:MAG: phosphoethanolamine transferase [Muribaculaceae bacterium]|nr:phosphoethanolamine transferase [Muribaculaceae bacterium]